MLTIFKMEKLTEYWEITARYGDDSDSDSDYDDEWQTFIAPRGELTTECVRLRKLGYKIIANRPIVNYSG